MADLSVPVRADSRPATDLHVHRTECAYVASGGTAQQVAI